MREQLRTTLQAEIGSVGVMKKLKLLITTLETALATFRDAQRRTYESLRKEEMDMTSELAEFETVAAEWSKETLADLDKRLTFVAPPVPPEGVTARRPRSASTGATKRPGSAGGVRPPPSPTVVAAHKLMEQLQSRPALDCDPVDEAKAEALRQRQKLERERKQAALEVYRLQKQAEELRAQQVSRFVRACPWLRAM